jgi:Xaa-Pro aminopeptidase
MSDIAYQNDLDEKRGKLREVMRRHDLRVTVLSSYQAVSYFAGTYIYTQLCLPDRLAFCLCFDDGSAALVLCSLETRLVQSQTDIGDIIEYTEFVDDPTTVLASVLKARGVTAGHIGVETRRLAARNAERLSDALPNLHFVGIDDEIEELQGVKTGLEVDRLQQACCSTLDAVEHGVSTFQAGMSQLELVGAIGSRLYSSGGVPQFIFFSAGERTLDSHPEAIAEPLVDGEIWRIDLGGRFYELLNSDVARTGVVGEPSQEQEDILQEMLAIQAAGFAAVEPGRPASEVYNVVKAEFARRKMDFRMPHIGHGIGIGIHESPVLQPLNHEPLRPGMVLAIEPLFKATERSECYHVEDIAVVTEDGHRLLTQPQSRLLRIGA